MLTRSDRSIVGSIPKLARGLSFVRFFEQSWYYSKVFQLFFEETKMLFIVNRHANPGLSINWAAPL